LKRFFCSLFFVLCFLFFVFCFLFFVFCFLFFVFRAPLVNGLVAWVFLIRTAPSVGNEGRPPGTFVFLL